jgi:hypothetical protein
VADLSLPFDPQRPRVTESDPMRRHLRLLALALSLLPLAACGITPAAPPVEISHRDSLVGQGEIVQIKNTSNQTLADVHVELRAPNGESRSFVEESIDSYSTLEVGWKRLGGWKVPPGSKVSVGARGYLFKARGTLPESAAD